jgi:hypothetical protein
VEVLLHSKRRVSLAHELTEDEEEWPLSLHLHYPAPSRAQKIHNVSLALSALSKAKGNPQQVEAKDIVDGYRERTVGLLWSILTRWGLDLLLDWDTIVKEIKRLEKTAFPHLQDDDGFTNLDRCDHAGLLQDWARCIAIKHGLVVKNTTTSFADGKVFAAIVREYEQYLPSCAKMDPKASLELKLKGIGCNSYFGSPSPITQS